MDGERLDPGVFDLPVERLRAGYYSDTYFNLTKELLERERMSPRVLMQVFQKHESMLGGIDEAIAVVKLGAGRYDSDGGLAARLGFARRRSAARGRPDRTVRDRDDDRRRLLDVRPPRNGLPRLPVAAIAGHAQRPSGVRRRPRQADPVLPGPARSLARADRGRLVGSHRRGDRGFDRRRRLVVGRPRGRDRPPRHDRGLRRRHGRGSARLRPRVRRAAERDGAGRLRQRLGGNGGRRRGRARKRPLGDPARYLRGTRWTPGSPGSIPMPPRACRSSSPSSFAGHSTMPGTSGSRSSSRAGSTLNGSRPSRPPALPSIPTASVPPCSRAATTSPRTSSSSTGGRSRRPAAPGAPGQHRRRWLRSSLEARIG